MRQGRDDTTDHPGLVSREAGVAERVSDTREASKQKPMFCRFFNAYVIILCMTTLTLWKVEINYLVNFPSERVNELLRPVSVGHWSSELAGQKKLYTLCI
jgi:hypothetical protein